MATQLSTYSAPKFSCIQDWNDGGEGNIETDPCFVNPGYWDPNGTPGDDSDDFWVNGDYHLLPDSPCIDAGDPNSDFTAEPLPHANRINMGAYGGTEQASKSPAN